MAQSGLKKIGDMAVRVATFALLAAIAFLLARIFWTLITPAGPVGGAAARQQSASLASLGAIDPFFRHAKPDTGSVVTGLPLKLFGTRIDDVTGLSSAIIATPDGLQSSYIVGESVMPGVKLASVGRDGVTIDRGGVVERLFLDQSVPAPGAAPTATLPLPLPLPAAYPPAQPVAPPTPPAQAPIAQTPGVAP